MSEDTIQVLAGAEDFLPLTEAASEMGLSRQGLHYRIQTGKIPARFLRLIPGNPRQLFVSREYIELQKNGGES